MDVRLVQCKCAASRSGLPGLDFALNPYRGCAHACSYCYAQDVTRFELGRPWGDVVEVKANVAQKLGKELEKGPRGVYGIGTVTDPYQPLEREYELTRRCLSVLRSARAEISVLTKSDLVLRDLDLLKASPKCEVGISIASLDPDVARFVEQGAPSPERRMAALAELADEGVRVYLMIAPVISGLSDSETSLRSLIREAHAANVRTVMWDKFNPKPMATSRLRKAMSEAGIEPSAVLTTEQSRSIHSILQEECSAIGMELLDAF